MIGRRAPEDQLEVRRLRRLIAPGLDAISPPGAEELARMARVATETRLPAPRARRVQPIRALAPVAVAAVAVGLLVSVGQRPQQHDAGPPATGGVATFPEGSALHLLITTARGSQQ